MKATIHKIRESKITLTKAQLLKSELQSKKLSLVRDTFQFMEGKTNTKKIY